MIKYEAGANCQTLFSMTGSVIPFAAKFAIPASLLAALIKTMWTALPSDIHTKLTVASTPYVSFTSLLAFLIIFQNSQAYDRYNSGGAIIQAMTGSWYDSISSLFVFTRRSKKPKAEVERFRHLMVRLFSLMHACALNGFEDDSNDNYNVESLKVLETHSIDEEMMNFLRKIDKKFDTIQHLVETAIVEGHDDGFIVLPPSLLNAMMTSIKGGAAKYREAQRFSLLPFPFPYAQVTLWLMLTHLIITPYMVASFTHGPLQAAFCSFFLTFTFWALHAVSLQLEHPFGCDANDLKLSTFQDAYNERLKLLLRLTEEEVMPSIREEIGLAQLKRVSHVPTCSLHESGFKSWQAIADLQSMSDDDDENSANDDDSEKGLLQPAAGGHARTGSNVVPSTQLTSQGSAPLFHEVSAGSSNAGPMPSARSIRMDNRGAAPNSARNPQAVFTAVAAPAGVISQGAAFGV